MVLYFGNECLEDNDKELGTHYNIGPGDVLIEAIEP